MKEEAAETTDGAISSRVAALLRGVQWPVLAEFGAIARAMRGLNPSSRGSPPGRPGGEPPYEGLSPLLVC